jgi:hypothetical protein
MSGTLGARNIILPRDATFGDILLRHLLVLRGKMDDCRPKCGVWRTGFPILVFPALGIPSFAASKCGETSSPDCEV